MSNFLNAYIVVLALFHNNSQCSNDRRILVDVQMAGASCLGFDFCDMVSLIHLRWGMTNRVLADKRTGLA
jgi:hypothetical protein